MALSSSPVRSSTPGAAREPDEEWLGGQIRALRKQKGLSLEEVGAATGRSIGFLSQIERGKSRPSVDDLVGLSNLLGIPFHALFYRAAELERGVVMRRENRPRIGYDNGISDFLLSPNLGGTTQLLLTTFEPHATSGDELFTDEGHETGFVLSGELRLWVDDAEFHLKAGDSFSYDGATPHRYLNPSDRPTEVVWAVTHG